MARPKGSPNRKTLALEELCDQMGIHPFVEMLKALTVTDEPRERFRMAAEIAQYLYPKRKAVELSASEDKGFIITVKDYTKDK